MQYSVGLSKHWVAVRGIGHIFYAFLVFLFAGSFIYRYLFPEPLTLPEQLSIAGLLCMAFAEALRQSFKFYAGYIKGNLRGMAHFDGKQLSYQPRGDASERTITRAQCRAYYPKREVFESHDGTRIALRPLQALAYGDPATDFTLRVFRTWWPSLDLSEARIEAAMPNKGERIALMVIFLLFVVLPYGATIIAGFMGLPGWFEELQGTGFLARITLLWIVLIVSCIARYLHLEEREVVLLPWQPVVKKWREAENDDS